MKKLSNFILIFLLGILLSLNAYSVPAKPGIIKFFQPNGEELSIYLFGDEFIKYAKTIDGYTLLFNEEGYYEYAVIDYRDNLVTSGVVAHEIGTRSLSEQNFVDNLNSNIYFSQEQIHYYKQLRNIYESELKATTAYPTTGNRKLICILMAFEDKAFSKTQADFNLLFNQIGYSTSGATGSVKDYYLENSYGQFNLTVDVVGPYTTNNNMSYYGGSDASGNDSNPRALVTEAVQKADPYVNFADYDNDNNGSVDAVYVIYAGYGEEAGGGANAIWAHQWSIPTITLDGKTISKYSCSAELRGSSGSNITRIGVICHEFGHVLGAPDYYDTNYATNGQYDGTGAWDLMAGGSWNNDGTTPAHHNAYTKIYIYNWASAITLSSQQNVALLNSAQNSNSFYRYNTTTTNEYFLLENRQKIGFDAKLPGNGMLIYHVDGPYIASHSSANDINVGAHQGMFPVPANANTANGVLTGDGAVSTTGCTWPGSTNKTQFTDATTPNSKSWAGANTAKPITDITEVSGVVQFCFMGCPPACTPPTSQASNFSITNIGDNQMRINWTRGNGTSIIVLARKAGAVTSNPVNGVTYTANASFGSGSEIGEGNFVVYSGTGTNVNVTGLDPGTTYNFSVYEFFTATKCYKIPSISGSAQTTGDAPCVYCYSYGHTTYGTSISKVGFNTINKSSAKETDGNGNAYSDYTNISTSLNIGSSYDLTVNLNTDGNYKTAAIAWIDWNKNCIFDAETEAYQLGYTSSVSDGATNLCPLSITVPLDAVPGETRMRVSAMYNDPGTLIYPNPCDTNIDGEVEDYTIIINQISNPTIMVNPTSLSFGEVEVGMSLVKSYQIAAYNLTNNLVVTAPSDFYVSTNSESGFANSFSLTPINGNVVPIEIFVKFEPSLDQTYTTNLINSSIGANSANIPLNGIGGYFVPEANFIGTPTTVLAGNQVTFSDLSVGTPATSWIWTFDGGTPNTSTEQNPVITYNTPGVYDVSLKAINSNGEDIETKVDYITVLDANTCLCDYISHIEGSLVYYKVQAGGYLSGNNAYKDKAKAEYFENTTNYNNLEGAYFGFGHVYVNNINTNITINVWHANGPSSGSYGFSPGTILASTTIPITRIEQDINASELTYVDFGVPIDITGKNFFIGFMIPNPAAAGDTLVLLTSMQNVGTDQGWGMGSDNAWSSYKDGWGASFNNAIYPVLCSVGMPNADFYANKTNITAGETVSFTDASTCSPTSWAWTFPGGTPSSSNLQNPSVVYNASGIYDVSLTVSNAYGADSYTYNAYITVTPPPVTIVNWDFPTTSSDKYSDGGIPSNNGTREIIVGGGVNAPTFTSNGATTRAASATGWASGNGTKYWQVSFETTAYENLKLYSKISANNTRSPRDFKVQYSLNGTSWIDVPNTNHTAVNGSWTTTGVLSNISLPNECNNKSLIYLRWIMTSNLSVSGSTVNSTAACLIDDIIVTGINMALPPIAEFSASNTSVCQEEVIDFTDQSTNNPTSWSWTFEGGTPATSNLQNPSVTYSNPGTYQVSLTVTNSGGSDTKTKTNYITINSNPSITASNNSPLCVGNTLNLSANGTGGSAYTWTGPASFTSSQQNPSRTNAQTNYAGTYTVTLTNPTTGCTASANTNVVVNANPTLIASNNGPVCVGNILNLSANGTGGSAYAWTGPASFTSSQQNPSRTNVQTNYAGIYTVTLTNPTTGCTASANTDVVINSNPTLTASNNSPLCVGNTLNLSANGTGGSTYAWTGPASFTSSQQNASRTNAQTNYAGTYTVTLTNPTTGCTASANTDVVINANPNVNLGDDIYSCPEEIVVLNAGGTNLTYLWSTGESSQSINITNSGAFSVTVTNLNSCTASDAINVSFYTQTSLAMSSTPESAIGQNDGTATVVATGVSPFNYLWNTGGNNATISNLAGGIYSVTVTDGNSCTTSGTISVVTNNNPPITNFIASSTSICEGSIIYFTDQSTNNPTSWIWTFEGGTPATSNLQNPSVTYSASGTYQVSLTATNSDGSSTETKLNYIIVNQNPTLTASNNSPLCVGNTLNLSANGTGGSTYAWTGPASFTSSQQNPSRTNAQTNYAGTYTVTLTNPTTGCTASANTDVVINANPNVNLGDDIYSCPEEIVVLNAGGTNLTYLWSTGESSQSINITNSGAFSVTVTNLNSCTASDAINVSFYTQTSLAMSSTPESAIGQNDGTATVVATGVSPFNYLWNNSGNNATISNLAGGIYTVTVTDGNSCTTSGSISVVTNNNPPIANFIASSTSICEGSVIYFTDQSTNNPISWAWTFEGGTPATSNLQNPSVTYSASGTYQVSLTATNSDGSNTETKLNYIIVNQNPTLTLGEDIVSCDGESVVLDAGNFETYLWSENSVSQTIEVLESGNYSVTVYDNNSCAATASIVVSFNPKPIVNLGDDQSICDNVELILHAGIGDYTYLWNDNSIEESVIVSSEGSYSVTITNEFNCSASDEVYITVNSSPDINLPDILEACVNEQFTYELENEYNYVEWSNGISGQVFQEIFDTTGEYEIWVIVQNDYCSNSDIMTVVVDVCENISEIGDSYSINLYPNPITNFTNLIINNYQGEIAYVIMDAQGKIIYSKQIFVDREFVEIMNLESLSSGVYFVSVSTLKEVKMFKLIKQ